jgi:hypothetical protein
MTKHVLDRPRAPSISRLAQFVGIERDATPKPASRTLQQRPAAPQGPQRLVIYTRIDRRDD